MRLNEQFETKQALGGDVTICLVTDASAESVATLFTKLWRQIFSFEKQFSRFLPMSELSVFNRQAGLKTPISQDFKDLLVAAKRLSEKTAGLYNPFILPALQQAGYVQSALKDYENDPQEDYSTRTVVDINQLIIHDDWATIPYGTALDMGGCGKGYLADKLRKTLDSKEVHGYWISLSGDVAVGGCDANRNGWELNIQDADNLAGVSDWVIQCPKTPFAVATSGTFRRKSHKNAGNWHHIIDTRTLQPAETDVRLATVCCPTAIEADVLASCAVILGSEESIPFLKKNGAVAALLQCSGNANQSFEKKWGRSIRASHSAQAGVKQHA